jgi:peptidyl-prolyl cis-trans isomerase SurA
MFMRLSAVFFVAACAVAQTCQAAEQPLDRIVAVVNDGVILQSELDRQIRIADGQLRQRGITPPSDDVLRSQVLDRLILMRLQTQRAQEAGIRVDDNELNSVLNNIAAQNHMNLSAFAERLRQDGIDFRSFREQVQDEMMIQRLRQKEVAAHVVVTDQDVDLFLSNSASSDDTEFHLSHILIAVPDGANAQARDKARKKAEDILKRARAGEDFAQLAIADSDGQQALQGGDLDWRKSANLPTIFANVAPRLAVNQVSDLIEASNGFNIIKLTGRRSTATPSMVTETHAEHILLKPNTLRDEDATRLQAIELYSRLKGGADFAALATKYSDDPGSKNVGGDLGWQAPGTFAPEFQATLDRLKPGETSEPFHTQFGWHIARVLDRRERDITQEARRNRAREEVFERKEAEQYEDWLRKLRSDGYVEYRTGNGSATSAS